MTQVLFLHGFSGTPSCGRFLQETLRKNHRELKWHAPALFHHDGAIEVIEEDAWEAQRSALEPYLGKQLHIIAYSLGARVALSLACAHPNALLSLTLVGVNPGLTSAEERRARRTLDEARAKAITNDKAAFFRKWDSLPLFQSQRLSAERQRFRQQERTSHPADAMAQSLRDFGLGTMTPLWEKLPTLEIPVRLVAGEYDTKYRQLHCDMLPLLRAGSATIAKGSGHDVTLHNPGAIAELFEFPSSLKSITRNIEEHPS